MLQILSRYIEHTKICISDCKMHALHIQANCYLYRILFTTSIPDFIQSYLCLKTTHMGVMDLFYFFNRHHPGK